MGISIPMAILMATATTAGVSLYQGEQQRKMQGKSLEAQKQAQKQAQSQAIGQEKLSAMAMAKANKKKPKIPSLLSQERLRSAQGPGATMLTGAGGAGGGGKMLLGRRSSLMGGN